MQDKLCVQNYRIGAVLTEMYARAEHLQKITEVKMRGFGWKPAVKHDSQIIYGPGDKFYAKMSFDPENPDYELTSSTHTDEFYQPYVVESLCSACCTGVLEANLNSNVIGVAHIGWISRDPTAESQMKSRHAEYCRSVEDLIGVFSIEKFIQLWGNTTCGTVSIDWLPCV